MKNERPHLTVNFAKWWPNFDREQNFLVNALREYFEVEVGADPDLLFFSVFQGEWPKGEYLKVFYTGEPRKPDMQLADWAFSYEYDEDIKHPRHMRLPLYVIDVDGRAFRADWGHALIKSDRYAERVLAEGRNGFCAYVAYYDGCARCTMFDALSRYRQVTAPGKSRNNAPPISDDDPEKSRVNDNFQVLKREFYRRFRFALVFENRHYPGYTTEKLVDAMAAGCIPIYWGNPEVVRDFNPRSFIDVSALEAEELSRLSNWLIRFPALYRWMAQQRVFPRAVGRAVARIREIDQDPSLRHAVLAEPWFHGNQPNRYFDPGRFVDRMREIGLDALRRRTSGMETIKSIPL